MEYVSIVRKISVQVNISLRAAARSKGNPAEYNRIAFQRAVAGYREGNQRSTASVGKPRRRGPLGVSEVRSPFEIGGAATFRAARSRNPVSEEMLPRSIAPCRTASRSTGQECADMWAACFRRDSRVRFGAAVRPDRAAKSCDSRNWVVCFRLLFACLGGRGASSFTR